jgi:hypothetical protein
MRAIMLAGLLLATSCKGTGPDTTRRVTELLGGRDSIAAIETARATAYRIDGMGSGAGAKLHGYPTLSGPVPVDEGSRAEIASVVLDDATYVWESAKACEFLPGVLLRYEAVETVDVLLCFSCDELEVYVGARKVGHEDFDPRRNDLVRVAKRLFPADKAIQSLR